MGLQRNVLCATLFLMAVGLDGVISQWSSFPPGQVSCGSRLVSGLFTRPQMPLGYTHVTTIPIGACRINVTEMALSNNYLAMRYTNGTFIVNGNFAISWSGEYEAAGTKFLYRRQSGSVVEAISAAGPLTQSIDILILYQHPNPGIKYEYTTHVPAEEDPQKTPPAPKPSVIAPPLLHGTFNGTATRRIYNVRNPVHAEDTIAPLNRNEDKKQINTGVNIEENLVDGKKPEAVMYPYGAGVLATESEKPQHPNRGRPRHRGRKFIWKVMQYTQCTKPCAGIQYPIYTCVRELSQTAVLEKRCGPKPTQITARPCGGPCAPRWVPGPWSGCSSSCGPATQTRTLDCRQDKSHNNLNMKVDDALCLDKQIITVQSCQLPDCPDTRTNDLDNTPNPQPNHVRSENIPRPYRARGFKNREGIDSFVDSSGPSVVTRFMNQTKVRPATDDDLSNDVSGNGGQKTSNRHWNNGNSWIYSEWTQECSEECGKGVQTRMVRCADPSGCEERRKPPDTRACSSDRKCATLSHKWFAGPWSPCSNPCAINGKMSREVVCLVYYKGQHKVGSGCSLLEKPDSETPCPLNMLRADCQSEWFTSDWSQCTGPCGSTQQTRMVICQGTPAASCTKPKPPTHRECVPSHCHLGGITPAPNIEKNRDEENILDDKPNSDECIDSISSCHLAVQARLCQYKYYGLKCCASCRRALSLS